MPLNNFLLVRDFLVPRLDQKIYGSSLQWVNRNTGTFKICWVHQGSKAWSTEMGRMFKDWALMKNKWDEGDPDRMVKAKQRIRAAFSRHRFVQRLPMKSLAFRLYRIRGFKSFVTCQKKPEGKAEPKLRSATPTGLFTGPVSWPMSEFVEEFVWFFDEFEIFSNDMSLPRPWWWEVSKDYCVFINFSVAQQYYWYI
ncbi:uncharacterized protein LOC8038241 [Ixodes scapularis]|uniref:uncharacterized protein LOC8038241 n=1 Tax=Ixodes scapularis TaxID=6945 RepID=UPI001A9ED837|nr:uncharacterized protein LOC8038241 [Ixodes scapularis]